MNQIQLLCESHILKGKVHTDSSNTVTGAIFIPIAYEQHQRDIIEGLFHANGYITIHQAEQAGVSAKRLETCILDNQSDAILFQKCIIHQDIIISPLQVVVEECIEAQSFLDLSLHLPGDILSCKDDINTIMMDHILNKTNSDGRLMLDQDEVLYFSQGMIDNITTNVLPQLIETFAKVRATEIIDTIDERKKKSIGNNNPSVITKEVGTSKKFKGKSKSKTKHTKKKSLHENEDGADVFLSSLIPLETVVSAVVEAYPGLSDIQESYNNDSINKPKWQKEDDDNECQGDYEGPVYGFCRLALNNDSRLETLCSNSVEAEMEKIIKTRRGSSMSKRGRGAAKCRSIEQQFEDKFPLACHLIQLTAKLPLAMDLDQETSEDNVDAVTSDYLHHCAWFAQRITEYCAFKAGLDTDDIFHFSKVDDKNDQEGFNFDVDLTQRHFSPVFLSCTTQDDGVWQDPLKLLREMMPGNIGVGLARMWIFTGGSHYDGGRRVGNDGNDFIRPGDMNKFLTHVEEFCL